MHNLHFLLVSAESAKEAATEAESAISDWGDCNNWHNVGGIASEDGSDDMENLEGGNWGLSYLDEIGGIPKDGTYFNRAVAALHKEIANPVTLPYGPSSTHPDLRSACAELGSRLQALGAEENCAMELSTIGLNIQHLSNLLLSRSDRERGDGIPQLYPGRFDEFGLTDLCEETEGSRRYLVFLDMHS
jgi:hypothetical protein